MADSNHPPAPAHWGPTGMIHDPSHGAFTHGEAFHMERTMMHTILGMLLVSPALFAGVGYTLVSRRP
ncbi:hypothetical protein [Mycobacterium sp. ACS1612]|uniref:hypothetical protein n=1 Tax=Mycobacterium sp. ACS1612 TaxID=1834117 RepID=UPI000A727B02|nr:hypothetical protein [Mycobacterium sp. ACS1612]